MRGRDITGDRDEALSCRRRTVFGIVAVSHDGTSILCSCSGCTYFLI